MPTAHGFDEFFGSLYHLNAEEEFENQDYFKDPAARLPQASRIAALEPAQQWAAAELFAAG